MLAIFQYFHSLIVDYFPHQMHRFEMCQLVESLLKDRASLYQTIFPQVQKSSRRTAVARTL